MCHPDRPCVIPSPPVSSRSSLCHPERSRGIFVRGTRSGVRHPPTAWERVVLLSVATAQTCAGLVTHAQRPVRLAALAQGDTGAVVGARLCHPERSRGILTRCTRSGVRQPPTAWERIVLVSSATSQAFARHVNHASRPVRLAALAQGDTGGCARDDTQGRSAW
jgi:hypothetical protein